MDATAVMSVHAREPISAGAEKVTTARVKEHKFVALSAPSSFGNT